MPSESESEGSGEDLRMHGDPNANDSSEEEEEDEAEYEKVRQGFIVDGDEDEEEGGEGEERRRKRKHRKRKRDAEMLDEDDLDLLAENTGARRPNPAGPSRSLKRFKRRGSNDLDGDDDGNGGGDADEPDLPGLNDMFNEPVASRVNRGGLDDDEDDDMDDFIEEDEDEDMDEEARAEMRRQKREVKRANARKVREYAGADQHTRQELEDIFGAGDEYAAALMEEEPARKRKGEIKYEDIFEPAEIANRHLLPDDDRVRESDIPERHQFATSTLSTNPIRIPHDMGDVFPPVEAAALWVGPRISAQARQLSMGFGYGWSDAEMDKTKRPQIYKEPQVVQSSFELAVKTALGFLHLDHLEVPYIWRHKRDDFMDENGFPWLNKEDLWICYDLGLRYKAVHEKRTSVQAIYDKMQDLDPTFADEYFETYVLGVPEGTIGQSVEAGGEASNWLEVRYPELMEGVKRVQGLSMDRKRAGGGKARKLRREGRLADFVKNFGLEPKAVAIQVTTGNRLEASSNPPARPIEIAEQYIGEFPLASAQSVLDAGTKLLVQEFGLDPLLRHRFRQVFKQECLISCLPTDKGKAKIDELHMYYPFKYLRFKPAGEFDGDRSFSFIQMLAAESEGLITLVLDFPENAYNQFYVDCIAAYDAGEGTGAPHQEAWSAVRSQIIERAMHDHLLPSSREWLRNELRQASEDAICQRCQDELEKRVDMQPYGTEDGNSVSVLAISFGRGGKDAIMAVFLDAKGLVGAQAKFDGMNTPEQVAEFENFVKEQSPEVIAIGGFTAETHRLHQHVDATLKNMAVPGAPDPGLARAREEWTYLAQARQIPLIWVRDEVARLFMNSKRAVDEYPAWPANARYALGLARFVQDPLNEYCALGADITAITLLPKYQALVSQEKLLQCCERALVNVVNAVGVDVNQAVKESYVQKLLPFVAGLGPRKADAFVKSLNRKGGVVANRKRLAIEDNLQYNIYRNAAAFLSLPFDFDENDIIDRHDDNTGPDPLDHTRLHPEDYEAVHDLVYNVLDIDPEDARDHNASKYVIQLMTDEDAKQKFDEREVDKFAGELLRRKGVASLHLVRLMAQELLHPFSDYRPKFQVADDNEILRMLTGETEETVGRGRIVTAYVSGVRREAAFIKLESGITGEIPPSYIVDNDTVDPRQYISKSQTVRGVVLKLNAKELFIEVTLRHVDVANAIQLQLIDSRDEKFDIGAEAADQVEQERRRRREQAALPRVVNHPLWKLMNKGAAEQFLAPLNRGDAVVRPSSQGHDHIAVTWKVDEGLYQHVDVLEIDKPSETELGRVLRVKDVASYSDLDELLVSHVQALASKVERLMQHEKYHPEHEIDDYLNNFVLAHPGSSAYGFSLDSDHPGHAKISFLARSLKDGGSVQSWPVKVKPGSYQLFDAEVSDMIGLCNAFKTQYRNKLEYQRQNPGYGSRTPGLGGRTPAMGGRTPAAGSRTPYITGGRTPMRPPHLAGTPQGGRTPLAAGPVYYHATTPGGYPAPNPAAMPPAARPPAPVGMNPDRLRMLQSSWNGQ